MQTDAETQNEPVILRHKIARETHPAAAAAASSATVAAAHQRWFEAQALAQQTLRTAEEQAHKLE